MDQNDKNFYVHFRNQQEFNKSTAESRVHYYYQSDIPGALEPAFKKMVRDGQKVFEFPFHSSLFATI